MITDLLDLLNKISFFVVDFVVDLIPDPAARVPVIVFLVTLLFFFYICYSVHKHPWWFDLPERDDAEEDKRE